jgi:transposase
MRLPHKPLVSYRALNFVTPGHANPRCERTFIASLERFAQGHSLTIREQVGILHRRLLAVVRDDDVCRRLMTIPGVGPVVALTFRVTVDVPARFRNSKAVGAVFGLTPAKYQSGENDRTGAISRCGDEMMRMMLYEAAQSMLLRSAKWSWLKAWAMKIARHRGMKKAIVALARRLAVIMHRIWVDGTEFRWTREVAAA